MAFVPASPTKWFLNERHLLLEPQSPVQFLFHSGPGLPGSPSNFAVESRLSSVIVLLSMTIGHWRSDSREHRLSSAVLPGTTPLVYIFSYKKLENLEQDLITSLPSSLH